MNMLGICLGGNRVCARNGSWKFPGKFYSWTLSGKCSGVFGWKFPDGPQISDRYGPVFGNGMERNSGHEMGVSSEIFSWT